MTGGTRTNTGRTDSSEVIVLLPDTTTTTSIGTETPTGEGDTKIIAIGLRALTAGDMWVKGMRNEMSVVATTMNQGNFLATIQMRMTTEDKGWEGEAITTIMTTEEALEEVVMMV